MKSKARFFISVSLLATIPALSYAQSSVTLYGDIGGGVRWTTGQSGGSAISFNNNVLTANRFGLFGKEPLGGNVNAIFKIESAFNSGTGALKNSGVLFSQAAYVGINGDYGRLTFGRQVSASEYFATLVDPTGSEQGQSLAIEPSALYYVNPFTYDTRYNNTAAYIGGAGGFRFGLSWSPGGVAGDQRAGTTVSIMALYQGGIGLGGFGYQKTWNATSTQWAETYLAGGSLQLGAARLYASYADFSISAKTPGAPTRRDHIPGVGASVEPATAWQFTAAFYYDSARHLANARDGNGHKITAYAIAEYAFSKRTEIYAEADFNGFSGAYRNDALNLSALGTHAGAGSATGVSLGIMTRF